MPRCTPLKKSTEYQLCISRAQGFLNVFQGNQVPDKKIAEDLHPLFAQDSPYYDDIVQLGDLETYQIEVEHWIAHWKETIPEKRPKQALDCLNAVNIDWYPNIKVILIPFFYSSCEYLQCEAFSF